jgi:hypothetical protein
MTPSTEPPSIEVMSILQFHRILIPIGLSEIDHLDRVIQDIKRYINPSASLSLLGLCTIFVSGPAGDIASDYQFHETKAVIVQQALDQIAGRNGIGSSRIITCVRVGGPPEVAAEAKRFQADLILLATPLWTNKAWFRSNISQLKRLTSCSVLLWPGPF